MLVTALPLKKATGAVPSSSSPATPRDAHGGCIKRTDAGNTIAVISPRLPELDSLPAETRSGGTRITLNVWPTASSSARSPRWHFAEFFISFCLALTVRRPRRFWITSVCARKSSKTSVSHPHPQRPTLYNPPCRMKFEPFFDEWASLHRNARVPFTSHPRAIGGTYRGSSWRPC